MRNALWPVALGLAGIIMTLAQPAVANVKAGVEAWNRGEYKQAVDEWRKDAIAGDADAQFNLAQAYKLGRGVPVDLPMAESWYRKAAAQGHEQAEDSYGIALFQNDKRTEALPWLEKSSARGYARAQLVLGTMLYNGDGVERDWPRAYALIVRASAAGLQEASSVQAQMDQYVPTEDRQKGLALARQYEADAQRPQMPADVAGTDKRVAMQNTNLPPSTYDPATGRPTVFTASQREKPRSQPAIVTPPQRPAKAKEATVAKSAPAGGWRIQFGAFRDDGNAKALWNKLRARVPAIAGLQPSFVRAGTLTKLQAGPLASGGEAARMCAAVKPTGNACVPVAP